MILRPGPKAHPRGSFAQQQKLLLEKRIDFGGWRKKPLARVTRNTAQNRRVTPLRWRLIKHAKLTSFEQRRIKNETAPRLRAGSDGLRVPDVILLLFLTCHLRPPLSRLGGRKPP